MSVERRILIITHRVPYPLRDGGNLATRAMIDGYVQAGWKVFLLSMNTPNYLVPEQELACIYNDLAGFEWLNINTETRTISVLKSYLFSKEPDHVLGYHQLPFEEKVIDVLKRFDPHVVQMESVYLSAYLPAVKQHSKAVTSLRLQHLEYQIWHGLTERYKHKFKKLYFENIRSRIRKFERKWWREFDLLLPITEKDAYSIKRFEHVNALIVAPYTIDAKAAPEPNGDEQWCGYHIGVMDSLPNNEAVHWFLAAVWPMIHKAIPKFEFYYAGRNTPPAFRALDTAGVFSVGEVASAAGFIADKRICIVPMWSGGGMRIKVVEAMAAGKVVISTEAGMRGVDARPGEHYLMIYKPEDFVRAINWCLDNQDAANEMAERARQMVLENYDHTPVMAKVTRELEQLLKVRTNWR